jgi:hypothetical protein
MAVDAIARIKARREAPFHVQIQVNSIPPEFSTPAEVLVEGRIVSVFRSDGRLMVGDRVSFAVRVCREGEETPPGPAYLAHEELVRATHIEAYLTGNPPHCEIPLEEYEVFTGFRAGPNMTVAQLESLPAGRPGSISTRERKWWQIWKG